MNGEDDGDRRQRYAEAIRGAVGYYVMSQVQSYEAADAAIAMADTEQRNLTGDCIRISEELNESRKTVGELSRQLDDAEHWQSVANKLREEVILLRARIDA